MCRCLATEEIRIDNQYWNTPDVNKKDKHKRKKSRLIDRATSTFNLRFFVRCRLTGIRASGRKRIEISIPDRPRAPRIDDEVRAYVRTYLRLIPRSRIRGSYTYRSGSYRRSDRRPLPSLRQLRVWRPEALGQWFPKDLAVSRVTDGTLRSTLRNIGCTLYRVFRNSRPLLTQRCFSWKCVSMRKNIFCRRRSLFTATLQLST